MRSENTVRTMSEQTNNAAPTDVHSIETKEPVRNQLAEDVERFLKKGGNIEAVPVDFRADPPQRPENTYGRGSI